MVIEWPWGKRRISPEDGEPKEGAASSGEIIRVKAWPLVALVAIVVLTGALLFANLSALGYANTYYTAGVKAMLQSWRNFFFVAAEPGGSVSIDKPPVGFWLQAASAAIFGVNTFGILLPQILAGMASVVVLYHLIQRRFGYVAGLIAALALAITPVMVATDRNNTIDSTLVLTLLLAAWAFIKATESGKLKFLLLGAALVGIGFNIKMLQAYLPLPAFYALYFLGSAERLPRKIGKLALATVLLLVVSLSWVTAVDLTPASQRPYVGSSSTNSAWNLAIGYNGVQRLLGMGRNSGSLTGVVERLFTGSDTSNNGFGSRGGFQPGQAPGQAPPGGFQALPGGTGAAAGQPPSQLTTPDGRAFDGGQDGNRGTFDDGGRGGFGGGAGAGGAGGAFNTGQAGPLRLVTGSLSNEISWLLPFGLFAGGLLIFRSRLHWPLSAKHQAVVLWGGWLLTAAVFFSVAGFFHPYYLVMLAPPLAGLVGLGVAELWQMREQRWWLALALTALAVGGTAALQLRTATNYAGLTWWLPLVIAVFIIGIILMVAAGRQWRRVAQAGFACLVAAMLITPGIWSGLTTAHSANPLPEAYSGQNGGFGGGGRGFGGPGGGSNVNVDQTLVSFLQANTQGMRYMMAVPSSQQGAGYVIATGRGVLYLGGFSGQDQVETPASLQALVANHELRYVYLGGGGGPGGGQSDVTSWVSSACKVVNYSDSSTGSGSTGSSGAFGGFGRGFGSGTLYDCQAS